jgi:hypothetical protein
MAWAVEMLRNHPGDRDYQLSARERIEAPHVWAWLLSAEMRCRGDARD